MNVSYTYVDTNLWNRLLDQHISPEELLNRLNYRSKTLALSSQSVHEFAKTFASDRHRAEKLFRHVKQYFDVGIGVALDAMEQLHVEVDALSSRRRISSRCLSYPLTGSMTPIIRWPHYAGR